MSQRIFDVAVIGGGVNGCGIARDAAGRGASVLLLERGDLASGTSSASTKLIHGGLRYLEHFEFGLVREALSERERLWAMAPHIIRPMRFVLPYVRGLRPRWMLRLGLFLYDHMGGRRDLPSAKSIDLRRHPAGKALKSGFGQAFLYSDGWVDDARLVVLNARDAADRGATIRTRTAVNILERREDHWVIHANNERFQARAIVNAAGPSVLDLIGLAGDVPDYRMRLVRGSHIVVRRLFDHDLAYFFQIPDGRIFFAIPYEHDFTLIGTTDRDHDGPLTDVQASEEEIRYLCDAANIYFARQITPDDVVWSYAGVRPLIDDGSGKPEAATRGYRLDLDVDAKGGTPMLSVFGGKITTYRHLAEAALEKLAPLVPAISGGIWTGGKPLPGGDFPKEQLALQIEALRRDYPFLSGISAERIGSAYGSLARLWLKDATSYPELGMDFGAGLSQAEVDYLIEREWARTADDILWRRSKLGLRLDAAQRNALEQYMGERL